MEGACLGEKMDLEHGAFWGAVYVGGGSVRGVGVTVWENLRTEQIHIATMNPTGVNRMSIHYFRF